MIYIIIIDHRLFALLKKKLEGSSSTNNNKGELVTLYGLNKMVLGTDL